MAIVTKSEICSDREIFGQAHACCTFSPSPSPSPGPCPRPEESAFSTYPRTVPATCSALVKLQGHMQSTHVKIIPCH